MTPEYLPGGQTWYFHPPPRQIFSGKKFSGTHPHGVYIIIILYSETRSRTVFFISFITDLWTPRNVALMILTPQSKIVPCIGPGVAIIRRVRSVSCACTAVASATN